MPIRVLSCRRHKETGPKGINLRGNRQIWSLKDQFLSPFAVPLQSGSAAPIQFPELSY
jgi:hypothetical protein